MKKEERYLFPADYMADPSVHVFNGRLYIYPSHDRESGIPENDNGDHFDMNDYHVLSTDDVMHGEIVDHGVALKVADIPWAGRQLWDCDIACKDGQYYLYFPLKDRNDIFRMGVAIGDKPEGPFIPQPDPIRGSYSIDAAVFRDEDGSYYMYFGGIWGGQLQRYRDNKAIEHPFLPEADEPALPSRVVNDANGDPNLVLARVYEINGHKALAARSNVLLDRDGAGESRHDRNHVTVYNADISVSRTCTFIETCGGFSFHNDYFRRILRIAVCEISLDCSGERSHACLNEDVCRAFAVIVVELLIRFHSHRSVSLHDP